MQDQTTKKKGLTKHRRPGGTKRRSRSGPSSATILERAKALNLAHLRGVPSFLFPDPPPSWAKNSKES